MRGRKVRISPGEVKKLGRRRKKSKNKPREVKKPGRERKKSRNKPQGNQEAGAWGERKVRISPGEVKRSQCAEGGKVKTTRENIKNRIEEINKELEKITKLDKKISARRIAMLQK